MLGVGDRHRQSIRGIGGGWITLRQQHADHHGDLRLFRVAGSASRKGNALTLTLVHSGVDEPAEVAVRLRGGAARDFRHTVLTHRELNAHNTFERPDEVVPRASTLEGGGRELHCVLPPASVNRLDVRLG